MRPVAVLFARPEISKPEREATPEPMARWLLDVARACFHEREEVGA